MKFPPRFIVYIFVFLEGAAVMAAELLGSKLIGPFYGNSLYIWSSVLGLTLLALTLGYYLGGYFSKYIFSNHKNIVYILYLFGGIWLCAMPWLSVKVMTQMLNANIIWSAIISLCFYLLPVLVLFAMTTPLFIQMLNNTSYESGRVAGSVYALSTLGGIIATFGFGFYLMPKYGITWPAFYLGVLLVFISLSILIFQNQYKYILAVIPIYFIFTFNSKRIALGGDTELIYESEGIFGQIRVIDAPVQTYLRGNHIGRTLYVNNVGQSTAFRDRLKYDSWDWSYFFPTIASVIPRGSDALLLGLGGGTILHQYERLGMNTEVVEIDERIKQTAINYFDVSPNSKILIDDARHFINTTTKTYDLITFDMFLNETPPAQVLSLETFIKMKKILRPNGLWMINYFGYTHGSKGKSARSILKTLYRAGYSVEILSPPSEDEGSRNLIFLVSHKPKDYSKTNYEEEGLPKIMDIRKHFLNLKEIDTADAEILTDAKPRFDFLYIEPSLDWRKRTIDYQIKPILESEINMIK